MTHTRTRRMPLVCLAAVAVLLPACGDDAADDEGADATTEGSVAVFEGCEPVGGVDAVADHEVEVELGEWQITGAETLEAGNVRMVASNIGADTHELLIVKADSADDLPLDEDGHLDESALSDEEFVGEIEPFPGGETCDAVFAMEPGRYVLVCAIVEEEDGEVEDHFGEGMHLEIEVPAGR